MHVCESRALGTKINKNIKQPSFGDQKEFARSFVFLAIQLFGSV